MKHFLYSIEPNELRSIIREELQLLLQQINSPPTKEEDEFLDIIGASDYLKLSHHSLRKKAQRSEIPCYKRNSKWLFSKKELKAFIQEGKQETISEIINK